MRGISNIHIGLLLGYCALAGCAGQTDLPANLAIPLQAAESWELYSIDPGWTEAPEPYPADAPQLHGNVVLGSTKITAAEVRNKLLALLKSAATDHPKSAACFAPRHMIRVQHHGQTIDLLICFQCNNACGYIDGERQQLFRLAPTPREPFNQLLTEQKIPQAP